MMDEGVDGADIIAAYVDQQSTMTGWTDRELTTRALQRSDEAARLAQDALERITKLERQLHSITTR